MKYVKTCWIPLERGVIRRKKISGIFEDLKYEKYLCEQ